MRRLTLNHVASAFVVMLVVLVLSSAIYFGQAGVQEDGYASFQNPLKPSYIYLLTYVFSGFVGLAIALRRIALPRDGFILLLVILGLMHLAWMPFAQFDAATSRTLILRLNVVVMTVCCQIIFSAVKDMKDVIRAVRAVVYGTCLLNLLVVVMPDLFAARMGAVSGRAAGLYWDPNQCATFLAMLLPLINFGLGRSTRMIQSLVVLAGIFLTFSREGLVLWIAAVLLSEVLQPGERRPKQMIRNCLLLGAFAVVLVTVLSLTWSGLIDNLRPYLNSDTYARLKGTDEGSTAERLLVLKAGWKVFAENPVFGGGYAATRSWGHGVSVHNMFILMLAEFGIVGGLWYVAFLGRIFTLPLRFGLVLGCLATIESLFTHSYFDLFYYMLLILLYWRFAALLAASQAERGAGSSPLQHGRPLQATQV